MVKQECITSGPPSLESLLHCGNIQTDTAFSELVTGFLTSTANCIAVLTLARAVFSEGI
jgi:hypothetical protein